MPGHVGSNRAHKEVFTLRKVGFNVGRGGIDLLF